MDAYGELKIKMFVALSRDEHGRETAGKWLTLMTRHCVDMKDAREIFEDVKACNPRAEHLIGEFIIRETFE